MKCPKCGEELTENVRFCPSCGTAVNQSSDKNTGINPLIPYIVTMIASIITVVANFIEYFTISGWFYSRKISLVRVIMETLNDPETEIPGVGDKVLFGLIVATVLFSFLTSLFAARKQMIRTIIFAVLALLPMLMTSKAYIHYIGIGITVIGAIWYIIVDKKEQ